MILPQILLLNSTKLVKNVIGCIFLQHNLTKNTCFFEILSNYLILREFCECVLIAIEYIDIYGSVDACHTAIRA